MWVNFRKLNVTTRKRSCGKVMFSHASVCLCPRGVVTSGGDHKHPHPRVTSDSAIETEARTVSKWAVRIPLDAFLLNMVLFLIRSR